MKSEDEYNLRKNHSMNNYILDKFRNYYFRKSTRGLGTIKNNKLLTEQNNNIYSNYEIKKNKNRTNFQRLSYINNDLNKNKLVKKFNLKLDKPRKRDTRDYNDNYKELQISIDSSFSDE